MVINDMDFQEVKKEVNELTRKMNRIYPFVRSLEKIIIGAIIIIVATAAISLYSLITTTKTLEAKIDKLIEQKK